MALGKLAVVDAPPSPAATPISTDQIPQAPSPSIDSLATDGYEHDTLPTDEPHTHVSSQERASLDASVLGTPNSIDANEGSVANPSHV